MIIPQAPHNLISASLVVLAMTTIATFPARADSFNDDAALFDYFNKQKIREQKDGIVLGRNTGRKKNTGSTLSLFGKNEDPLPNNSYRNNYSSRDWSKQPPTTILRFGVRF